MSNKEKILKKIEFNTEVTARLLQALIEKKYPEMTEEIRGTIRAMKNVRGYTDDIYLYYTDGD